MVGVGLFWAVATAAALGDTALPEANSMLEWSPAETLLGFRQVENIFPTLRVRRGDVVHPLSQADQELEVRFDWQGESWSVEDYMQRHRLTGLLVLQGDDILLERYAHGRSRDDRWVSFSMAKSLTSTLVGAAIRDGDIDGLHAPLTATVPELIGSAYDGVTVRQLLTMTSGVAWNEDYDDPASDVAELFAEPMVDRESPVLSYLRRLPRAHAPGSQFNYNTGETELVGVLVARATGRNLADYLSEKIWAPFGMERDALWQVHEDGQAMGGCCLNFTLRDQGRFGRFILGGGMIDDEAVLPEEWLDLATQPLIELEGGQGYGFQWWTRDGTFQALGIFGQMMLLDPELDLVIVVNAAWPNTGDDELRAARWALVDAVRSAAGPSPR